MSNIIEQSIDTYVSKSLIDFGKGVNTERQLVLVNDGLKPVYRRAIYTAMQLGDKLTKTASISGNCIAKYHPHSSDAVDAVISSLVRWGIFEGQGNHGMKMIYGDDIYPAASRYTEAKLANSWRDIFKNLIPYVPYKEAEMEGNVEPEYLPTPVPLVLLFSGLGIGFGVNARYPMFTAKSMLEALTHNNPNLLEAPKGLIIDHANSELEELWNTGLGRICYKFEVTKCGISSGYGSMISGSPEIFKPNLEKAFEEELARGQVYILDQTSGDIPQVFVGRSPNVRAVSLDDIQDTCEQVCQITRMFRLTVASDSEVYVIPLKTWLEDCFCNYVKLIDVYKQDSINKLKFEYDVYTWLPIITDCLMKNRHYTAEDLSKENNCDIEIVKAILRKSISTLRNVDSVDKLKGIQASIKQFEQLDSTLYAMEYYSNL